MLGYAVLLYLWCALLFPRDLEGYDGFKDYYYSRGQWLFGLLVLGQAVDLADTLLKGVDYFRSLGPSYPIAIGIMTLLLLIAMRTSSERFHAAFAIYSVASLVVYPWVSFDRVG